LLLSIAAGVISRLTAMGVLAPLPFRFAYYY